MAECRRDSEHQPRVQRYQGMPFHQPLDCFKQSNHAEESFREHDPSSLGCYSEVRCGPSDLTVALMMVYPPRVFSLCMYECPPIGLVNLRSGTRTLMALCALLSGEVNDYRLIEDHNRFADDLCST